MNLLTRLTTIGVLLLAPAAFAASSFEGKVTMTMTSGKGDSHTLNYMMKGPMMRMEMDGAPASMIMDLGRRQMTILMHQQHMYMVRPIPQSQETGPNQSASPGGPPSDHAMPDVQSTGKTERILGYTCNQFLIKDGDKTTELWLAPGLGVFMGLSTGGSPFGGRGNSQVAAKWEQAFKGKPGFPLRVITHDAAGKVTMRMEVTKIDTGGVSDADFAPPPGYRQFQMPNIPGFGPPGGG